MTNIASGGQGLSKGVVPVMVAVINNIDDGIL